MSRTGLKLLIVARYADRRGGADVYTEALAINMAKSGHEVELVCHAASEKVHSACRVTKVEEPNFGSVKALWRIAPLLYQRHWRRVLSRCKTRTPDVIISSLPLSSGDLKRQFPDTPWIYLPHSRIAPIEATAIESNSRIQLTLTRRVYARWERWSLLNANMTVRFTAGNERELRAYYDLPTETNFRIIAAPVEFTGGKRQPDSNAPLRLVSVSRLVESKNLLWMLHQLATVKSLDWHWTIAGDGPQHADLLQTAERLGVSDRVTFLGFCEDVAEVYRNADLHLFPSRRESLGLVILEAMAFGVPTLAFRPDAKQYQTASDEIIEHRVNGLLAMDESDFKRQLQECFARRQSLLTMGETGRQQVVSHHTWDHVATVWQDLLHQIVYLPRSTRSPEVAHA